MDVTIEVLSMNPNALEQIKMAFNRSDKTTPLNDVMTDIAKELGYDVSNEDDRYKFNDKE